MSDNPNSNCSFDKFSVIKIFDKLQDQDKIEFLAQNFGVFGAMRAFIDVTHEPMSERVNRVYDLLYPSQDFGKFKELCDQISDEDLILCVNSNTAILKVIRLNDTRLSKLVKQIKIDENNISNYDVMRLDQCSRFMTNSQLIKIMSSSATRDTISSTTKNFCNRNPTVAMWSKALRFDKNQVYVRELSGIIPEEIQVKYLCKLYNNQRSRIEPITYIGVWAVQQAFKNISNPISLVQFFLDNAKNTSSFNSKEWEQDLRTFFLTHDGYSDSIIKDLGCKLTKSDFILNRL